MHKQVVQKIGISVILLLLTQVVWAQTNQAVFVAYADAKQVLLNRYFEVTFTLKNADGRQFQPPSFNDFIIISGPSRSARTSVINGNVSKEISFIYTLQPKRTGKFNIGSAMISANNKTLRTRPFAIEVIEPKEGETGTQDQFFIRAELSTNEAYVGQQVKLDYKLYYQVDIQNFNISKESDYTGFYAEDIQRPDGRRRQEIIDGQQYVTKVLKSVALYPQQTGTLTIDPAVVQLGVVSNSDRRPRNFFFGNEVKRVPTTTEAVKLVVKSIPPNAPPSFSGAVGRYSVTTEISRTTLTTDDALTLRMLIRGSGDIKRVQTPELEAPESFESLDPNVVEEYVGEQNSYRDGQKLIEYTYLPREAGRFSLQPKFTYFDPDSSKYLTLVGAYYDLTVRQGTATKSAIAPSDNEEMDQLNFIQLDTRLRRKRTFFIGSIGYWLAMLFPVLGLIGAVFYKNKLQALANIDPALLKSQKANKVALARLDTAKAFLDQNNSRSFYDEVSKAMMGYVSDKLKLPKSEMTKTNMRQRLEQLQVEEEKVEQFVQIVKNCEMALFAGMDNSEAMQSSYDNALSVLAAIEKQVSTD